MRQLQTIDAETLLSSPLPVTKFIVEELLPEGLHILAGATKIGKSWLALWICLQVSKGEPVGSCQQHGEPSSISAWRTATSVFKTVYSNSQTPHRAHYISQIYLAVSETDWRIKSQLFSPNIRPPALLLLILCKKSGVSFQIPILMHAIIATFLR